ncbi:hypothetical protein P7K49_002345 [Saguinus oedipus]|uniref:Uncharacterized protein n=1 Tax=Saguinus oedipus TaxID=9490 RepID=A0ABQ9WH44_SAGOE|nr:hypothetical protein P7K49_002345 [Saguinus oedipus]
MQLESVSGQEEGAARGDGAPLGAALQVLWDGKPWRMCGWEKLEQQGAVEAK